jgi:hypothetical protein
LSRFDASQASRLAALALEGVQREFPCNPGHVLRDASELRLPRALHPAFYGCFDWHSAVHGHWLLAHLLRRFPQLRLADEIRGALDQNLRAENISAEARYFKTRNYFERPYGWAWLLKLARELAEWEDRDAARWSANLEPLAETVEALYRQWLPKQTYPVRAGVHSNTAFGIAFALDYARSAKRAELENLLVRKTLEYFSGDRDYPAAWEPGGNDFLSPCLVEADLMRRVLAPEEFRRWFEAFLPKIPATLLTPATVSDRADGQLVHLDGLNLSRAWCYFALGAAMPENALLRTAAEAHLQAGLAEIFSGHYEGEHWLASFAALAWASRA